MNSQPEAEVEQWEALDLGDSELPSFLRPCKRKSPPRSLQTPTPQQNPKAGFNSNTNHHQILQSCSSRNHLPEDSYSRSLIPGPAGIVQVAVRRKMNKDPKSFNDHGEPIPTQEFIRKAAEEPDWEDKDFSEVPWLSAVDYIRSEGLMSNGGNAIGTPVSQIKSGCGSWDKVDQVVAIVKTCTPNGLGDVMVTLKDPTGTIDASVHRKVISESEFGRDIRVGAVVILKKVAFCAPSRSSCYLNITLKNISKVITKDTPVLSKQKDSETSAVNEKEEYMRREPVEKGTTQGIMKSLRQNGNEGSKAVTDVEINPAEEGNLCPKSVTENECEVRMEKTLLGEDDPISQTEIAASRRTSNIHKRQLQEDGTDTSSDLRRMKQICRSGEQESAVTGNSNEVNKSQPMASSSSVPQWTDEQLEELFDFD